MNPPLAPSAHPRSLLLIIAMISSLVMLDSNVVAVALPTIARSLNADFADVQWVITAYVLPFAALLLAAGSFGDKVGRRLAAMIGLAIFGLSSLACGMATTPTMLNVSRAVQGVGASLVLTASLALINHIYTGLERIRAFAFWGASLGIAITCGPIIGGVIASVFGWTWAFLINVPICTALFVAALRVIPESRDPDVRGLDYAGIVTFSAGLFLVTWAVIDGNALGWLSAPILWRFLGGLALLVLFAVVELRQERPMVDFAIFRSRHFIGTAFAMVGYAGGAQVMIFYLPLYLQNAYGFSPAIAGIATLPFALPMFVVPRIGAGAGVSSRTLICAGLAITVSANLAMALLADGQASYLGFALAMVVAGAGAGLLNGETAKAMQGALPANRSGVASGISATTRFMALLFGVAGLGALLVSVTMSRFAAVAAQLGLQPAAASLLAKRYAAGDSSAAVASLPEAVRAAAGILLHGAFQEGFSRVAWAAAAVAIASLLLTRWFMQIPSHHLAARTEAEALFVAGE
ncbi:MFS transporter [Rugamonas sp.]|uniref:MFS transporter n=1 Tax=Rugamonas sp. TaxID=1926287 RepID=UPI0025E0C4D1|nr:MFS transporter [Rugamonas sp.]